MTGTLKLFAVAALLAAAWVDAERFAAAASPPSESPRTDPAALAFFERKVRPVLVERCYDCHGPDSEYEAGLRLDSLAAMLKGGRSGPAIAVGQPGGSLMILAINHDTTTVHMPPKTKLPYEEIANLTAWVKMGAPWTNAEVPDRLTTDPAQEAGFSQSERSFWAFQSPAEPPLPPVRRTNWPRSSLDRFVLAGLEAQGLRPAPPADKRTLIRRATIDLLGLPPPPVDVAAFLADRSPDAFARVVDRLLASPRYGERWGRHWLDVVRYADSNGMDDNLAYADAWRYRDYVIAAFNRDKPFDQFVREQLAGDLLPDRQTFEGLIATGMLMIGPKMLAEDDPIKQQMDIVDDQIDTVGRAFMGLTLGCARCHDHKFDPVRMSDYYALAGIFKSTKVMLSYRVDSKWNAAALGPPPCEERLTALERQIDTLDNILVNGSRVNMTADERKRLSQRYEAARAKYDEIPKAMAAGEGPVEDLEIFLRGNHLTRGVKVRRRFPRILAGDGQTTIGPRTSGRLQLARWLTSPAHPLTSRVMVNRIWRGHFGRGIVRSPNNFGRLGERPDNGPLLDWLARRFVESRWSVKAMHRLIMLSGAYQMSTRHSERSAAVDPENRLLWRMNRHRMEAEVIRDSILAVSGRLDLTMGGTLLAARNFDNLSTGDAKKSVRYDSNRRSVYLPVVRSALYDVFAAFDFPDPAVVAGRRASTTVAPQALFMLNSQIVQQASRQMSADLLGSVFGDDAARIQSVYRQVLGRPAEADETAAWLQFLKRHEQSRDQEVVDPQERRRASWQSLCRVILSSGEFIYVE